AQQVGYVLEMEGTWTLKGSSKPLSPGETVPAAGVIRNQSPSGDDHITIANLNGEIIKRIRCKSGSCYECRESGTCYDAVQSLPIAPPKAGMAAVTLDAVMKLILGEPDRYSVHRVRGKELPNGVAELRGDQLDLSSIFSKQGEGRYYL